MALIIFSFQMIKALESKELFDIWKNEFNSTEIYAHLQTRKLPENNNKKIMR
jgi:hypothetical protein